MPESLLSITEVSRRVSLSKTTIYARIRAKTFPRPRDLGPGCVRWLESEIDQWIAELPATGGTINRGVNGVRTKA